MMAAYDRTRTLDRQGFNAIGNIEAVAVDLFFAMMTVSFFYLSDEIS